MAKKTIFPVNGFMDGTKKIILGPDGKMIKTIVFTLKGGKK